MSVENSSIKSQKQPPKRPSQSIEEYNNVQTNMNDRMFTRVDEYFDKEPKKLWDQTDEANLEVIDIDEKEVSANEKSENYENFILETRSEGNKDDQNSLENAYTKSKKQNNKKQKKNKNKRNNDRKNKNIANHDKNRQNNEKSVKIEEVKQTQSSKMNFGSEPDHSISGTETYVDSKSQEFKFSKRVDSGINSNIKFGKKQLSCASEVKSTMSEEKNISRKGKNLNFMNNTSEISSAIDSSAASFHENRKTNYSSKQSAKCGSPTSNDWIQQERKSKKFGTQKNKRVAKNEKQNNKPPRVQDTGHRSSNNDSDSPTNSIWNQENARSIFSPQGDKKSKKSKKKGGNTKKVIQWDSSEGKNTTEKYESKSTQDVKEDYESDMGVQKLKDIEIEEKKIDLSVKPTFLSPKSPRSQQAKADIEISSTGSRESVKMDKASPIFTSKNSSKRANKPTIQEEIKKQQIPITTISSFYQWDTITEEATNLDRHNSEPWSNDYYQNYFGEQNMQQNNQYYHDSYTVNYQPQYQNYGQNGMYTNDVQYYGDYTQNIPNHTNYMGYSNMGYNPQEDGLVKNHSVPLTPSDPIETHNIEWERLLYQTLSIEIENEVNKITESVELIKDYRFDIKEQLEAIVVDTFYNSHKNVQAHIYGSVATGLALTESDMDIVITGINSFGNKEDHSKYISTLYSNITSFFDTTILVDKKEILHTQVPIIKLKFSLPDYYQKRWYEDQWKLPEIDFESDCIDKNLKYLAVDISLWDSFENNEHQGMRQAMFVQQKLQEFPILKPVCLMLK